MNHNQVLHHFLRQLRTVYPLIAAHHPTPASPVSDCYAKNSCCGIPAKIKAALGGAGMDAFNTAGAHS